MQVALITGGSRGIGKAIALKLGSLGYKVAINYRSRQDAAEEVAGEIKSTGGDAGIYPCDISDRDDHQRLVEAIENELGPIDLLVNNAGMAPKVRADLLEVGEESYDQLMATNLKGPFFLSQLVAKRMLAQPSAKTRKIVNVGSLSSYTASVARGEYCLSKAGIGMMTKLFAARLAEDNINVFEIRPGVIETDMTGVVKEKYDKLILEDEPGLSPIRRWGQPDDIAQAVAAIAQDHFPFSTGSVLDVDGGFHLRRL